VRGAGGPEGSGESPAAGEGGVGVVRGAQGREGGLRVAGRARQPARGASEGGPGIVRAA